MLGPAIEKKRGIILWKTGFNWKAKAVWFGYSYWRRLGFEEREEAFAMVPKFG